MTLNSNVLMDWAGHTTLINVGEKNRHALVNEVPTAHELKLEDVSRPPRRAL